MRNSGNSWLEIFKQLFSFSFLNPFSMSDLTRKDFLRLSSWGMVAAILPIYKVNALASIFESPPNLLLNFDEAKRIAVLAKEAFYRKDFRRAEELYLQSIRLAPAAICFYDGLENVYGATGDILASVQLFNNGIILNPRIISFYDRAARSLMRLELGRKFLARQYRDSIRSESLLQDAKTLYETAISIDRKLYLTQGLAKVQHKIDTNAVNIDYTRDAENIALRRLNRSRYKEHFANQSDNKILQYLERIDLKRRTLLYTQKEIDQRAKHIILQKKKYLRILLSRRLDAPLEMEYTLLLFNLDHGDSNSLRQARKVFYSRQMYGDFIALRSKNAVASNTVYAFLGVMDAIQIAYLARQVDLNKINEAVRIGEDLIRNWAMLDTPYIDVVDKLAKMYFFAGDFSSASQLLENAFNQITLSSPSANNKIILTYANLYIKQGRNEQAMNILLTGLNELDGVQSQFPQIEVLAQQKVGEIMVDKLPLYYLLYEVYKSLGRLTEAADLLFRLEVNNPEDNFVLIRN